MVARSQEYMRGYNAALTAKRYETIARVDALSDREKLRAEGAQKAKQKCLAEIDRSYALIGLKTHIRKQGCVLALRHLRQRIEKRV